MRTPVVGGARRSLRDLIGSAVVSALVGAALLAFGYPPKSAVGALGAFVSAKFAGFLADLFDLPAETTNAYLGALLLAVALWIAHAGVESPYTPAVGALAAGWILDGAVSSYRRTNADEREAAAL